MQRAEAGNSPADDNPPAGDPPAGDPLPPPQITGLTHLLVGAAATALMTGIVIYLIYLGDRGNTIAGPLALLVGFITLVVTLLLYLASAGVIQLHPRPWLRAALQGVAAFFIVGSFSATAAFIGVAVIDRQIPITNLIQIENPTPMTNADTAIVEIPEPTRRSAVAITPILKSANPGVGNCEDSAVLSLTAIIDGVSRTYLTGERHQREVKIMLRGVEGAAEIRIQVDFPRDQTCVVNLHIREAFLYNQQGMLQHA